MDCRTPPASRAITAARASVEKRARPRPEPRPVSGSSRRVAAGSDATSDRDAADPRARREHVDDVGGEEHGDRRLHAGVAAETGEEGQREQRNGEQRDRARGRAAPSRRRRPSRAAAPGRRPPRRGEHDDEEPGETPAPQTTPKRVLEHVAHRRRARTTATCRSPVAACSASAAAAASAPTHAGDRPAARAGGARRPRTRLPVVERRPSAAGGRRSPGSHGQQEHDERADAERDGPYSTARTGANATARDRSRRPSLPAAGRRSRRCRAGCRR